MVGEMVNMVGVMDRVREVMDMFREVTNMVGIPGILRISGSFALETLEVSNVIFPGIVT